jgi:putative hydrolase of the HAD superfamily
MRVVYPQLDRWRLYADTFPVLKRLKDLGWSHILLSNHVPELTRILTHLGLMPYLEAVLNSAETGYEKPNPLVFNLGLEKAGFPARVWMVGDNPVTDVAGAEGAGIPAILVRNQSGGARFTCETLYAAGSIIESDF